MFPLPLSTWCCLWCVRHVVYVLCDGQQLNFWLPQRTFFQWTPWVSDMSGFLPAVALSLCRSASTVEEPGRQFLSPQFDPPQPPKFFEVLVGVLVAPSFFFFFFFFSVTEDSSSGKSSGLNLLVASPDWDFWRIFFQSFLDSSWSSCCGGKTDEPETGTPDTGDLR